jgi:hypothetical protein
VSSPPSKPTKAGTSQTSKRKSGGGSDAAIWIPILLVVGGAIAAWRALRRSRQRQIQ